MEQNGALVAELNDVIASLTRTSYRFSGPVSAQEITIAEWELVFVFPPSYRTFLQHWGSGRSERLRILGLHAADLHDDVVMANLRFSATIDVRYLKFAVNDGGMSFCFDRFDRTGDGECPIVITEGPAHRSRTATSFLQFLRKMSEDVIQPEKGAVVPIRQCTAAAASMLSTGANTHSEADEQKLAV